MDDPSKLEIINGLFTNAVEDSLLVLADIVNSNHVSNDERIAAAAAVAAFAPLFTPEVKYVVAEGGGGLIQ